MFDLLLGLEQQDRDASRLFPACMWRVILPLSSQTCGEAVPAEADNTRAFTVTSAAHRAAPQKHGTQARLCPVY